MVRYFCKRNKGAANAAPYRDTRELSPCVPADNIGKIKKIPFPEKSVSGSKAQNGKISFDNSISQSDNNVNTSIRSEQQKDTSFDKPMSVSRKQRGTEEALDSDSGSVVTSLILY